MTLDEAKKIIKSECYIADLLDLDRTQMVNTALDTVIEAAEETRWIPVKWHEITEEEREIEGFPKEWVVYFDCIMPDDEEEILICTEHGEVLKDTNYEDDGNYLDSGYDWVDDVIAWMPLPQPYKAEGSDEE